MTHARRAGAARRARGRCRGAGERGDPRGDAGGAAPPGAAGVRRRPAVAGVAAAVDARPGHRRGRGRRDHVWVLHRPWSLTDDEKAQNPEAPCCTAAPHVLEFDAGGRYLRGWGGPGAGYEWPEDEHAIHVDHKRNVWITSAWRSAAAGRQGEPDPEVHQRRPLPAADRPARAEQGLARHRQRQQRRRRLVEPTTNELYVADGYVNRRVIVYDADTGAFKRMWGAYGKPPDDAARNGDLRRSGAGAVQPGARPARVARRQGLRRRSPQQPDAGLHDGRGLRAGDLRRAHDKLLGTAFAVAFSPDRGSVCSIWPTPATAGCASTTARRSPRAGAIGRIGRYAGQFVFLHALAVDSRATSTRPRSAPGGACRSS